MACDTLWASRVRQTHRGWRNYHPLSCPAAMHMMADDYPRQVGTPLQSRPDAGNIDGETLKPPHRPIGGLIWPPPQSGHISQDHGRTSVAEDASPGNAAAGQPPSSAATAVVAALPAAARSTAATKPLRAPSSTRAPPFSCALCSKEFSQRGNLTSHLRSHTGERPFSCTVCPKSFSHKGNLTKHLRIHTGDKPFSCSQCPKAFSVKYSLTVHMRTHSGERPFRCNRCDKSFSVKDRLLVGQFACMYKTDVWFDCPCLCIGTAPAPMLVPGGNCADQPAHRCYLCHRVCVGTCTHTYRRPAVYLRRLPSSLLREE